MFVSKSKVKFERKNISDKIMTALLIGLAIPAVLASPYGAYAMVRAGARYYFRKQDFNREARRLQKRGFISLTKMEEGWLVKLLPKGRNKLKQIEFESLKLPKTKTWDHKWRLFSFDILEEYKVARDLLRRKLKALGCYNIQRSLLAYPYNCREELMEIAKHYKVEKFTLFAEVTNIDLDKELRKFYHL